MLYYALIKTSERAMNKSLIRNISQAYVMSTYLSKLCQQIGRDNYITSHIRNEHGTGLGFFGVSNTGSTDCIKERLRGITDSIGLVYKTPQHIKFISASCVNLVNFNFRTTYRVEHTREISELYLEFEEKFIMSGISFTPADLGTWLITNQVVCLILQIEQLSKSFYDLNRPFSKYSTSIMYNDTDISNYTISQLQNIAAKEYATELAGIQSFNFSNELEKQTANLITKTKKHTLPPMELAVQYYNDHYELLSQYYMHKVFKRTDPSNTKWYDESDAHKYKVFITTGVKL